MTLTDDCEVAFEFEDTEDILLSSPSQQSSIYAVDDGIDEAILAYSIEEHAEESPPLSVTTLSSSLGKRKADDSAFEPHTVKIAKIVENGPIGDVHSGSFKYKLNDPVVISPPTPQQRFFEARHLPYGCQYEIARLVSSGRTRYEDIITDVIDSLAKMKTNAVAAPETAKLLLNEKDDLAWKKLFAKEISAKSPWEELDTEEEAFKADKFMPLGFTEKSQTWFGGKVHFRAVLKDSEHNNAERNPQFKLVLERAELGPSDRFARRFGSKCFIRLKLKLSKNKKYSLELFNYLTRPFVICGGVFRAFFAKDTTIFLIKTNETYDSLSKAIIANESIPGVFPCSFLDFVAWYNDLHWNTTQTMAKWASRFALGLSNSVPGLLLEKGRIVIGSDIISSAKSDMTDGAGTINRAGLLLLYHKLGWETMPSAVQVRVLGSKGLLVLDRDNKDMEPFVTLLPSQVKIRYPLISLDQANLVIDVLRTSHTRTPCRLSTEIIINLAENGVPYSAFLQLLKNGLDNLIQPLLNWDGPTAMQDLWVTLERIGGVIAARRAREDVGSARINGLSERDVDETENDDQDDLQLNTTEQRSSAWWGDECSGCPSCLEETVMTLLDSGFTPDNCFILRDKLEKIVRSKVKEYIKAYKIDVPMSAIAFLVPDTLGILEPGEVFFKCSRRHLENIDGSETDIITGDILLTRHPCKLPTDVQKWKAVDRVELHYLTDVIVCSTKGDRRAADFLAGGDYDGDKGTIIWQPELVKPFKNAPLHFSEPPKGIEENFSKKNELVSDFLSRTSSMAGAAMMRELQHYLLGAIRDTTVVGMYSSFHDNATYTLGYQASETKRLAYMFCMILDGSKSGMTVLPEVLSKDAKRYNHRPPAWKETEEDRKLHFEQGRNDLNLRRPSTLGAFIMDELHRQAEDEGKKRLGNIDATFEHKTRCSVDTDLTEPWRKAKARSERWIVEYGVDKVQKELSKLEEHVEKVYAEHRKAMIARGKSFTDLPIEVRQDKFRDLSKSFASFPPSGEFIGMSDEEVARVRASYAYHYDTQKNPRRFSRFPWDVSMRELCAIKVRALGRPKTVTAGFYECFNIKRRKHQR